MITADPVDPNGRAKAFREGIPVMLRHEAAEERTIYDFVARDHDIRPLALEALEEHKLMRIFMTELNETPVNDDKWLPRVIVLNNISVMHMQIRGEQLPFFCSR